MPTPSPLLAALAPLALATATLACSSDDHGVKDRAVAAAQDSAEDNATNATDDATNEVDNTPTVGQADEDGWITMFNGEDLTGWTPKISGYELGENPLNTFRVEDGKLVVAYDEYDNFEGRFGHLFYVGVDEEPAEFSHYIMQIEYRFTGDLVAGGPGWAVENNGIMFHGQPADTMGLDQDFPASIEAQMLGDKNGPTGNVCTPGTHIHKDGELTHAHVISFDGPRLPGNEWVTYELEVHGSQRAIHRINGEVVADYGPFVLDPNDTACAGDAEAQRRGTTELAYGTISLQAEAAPVEFRNIRIKVLEEDAE
ncbi:MAG: DUF1080 domain-containing protein [Planctomycetota bacterium]